MKYKSAAAFRTALEARLRDRSLKTGASLSRLRKMVAFDRLLARLGAEDPKGWIIKGGLALQLRLGDVARTTKDVDATTMQSLTREEATARLRNTAAIDLGDWFEFEIAEPNAAATGAPEGGLSYPVRCLVDGRDFEIFHLDLGQGDPVTDQPEILTGPALLEFAEIAPAKVLCYPLTTQLAEKVHAYTRPYARGESSRIRDLVDIVLIASKRSLDSVKLSDALRATFDVRRTHELPKELPQPPAVWSGPYKKLAGELNLSWPTIEDAWDAAASFLNHVLKGTATGMWDPASWSWP